ncbi:MAG: MATE family efflux transporter [Oscillospiraceae bacterium]
MATDNRSGALIHDLTTGSVTKKLLLFAAPLFLSSLLQVVYNMVDMAVVGQAVGKSGLSAVSLGGDVLTALTFVATGLSNAGQVIISQFIGADQRGHLNRLIGTMFTFLLSSALVLSALCLLLREQILQWINTPPEALSYARDYLIPCALGLFFIYGYNMVSAILRGMGDSRHPFLFIATASVLNVLLDLLFVLRLGWGTRGAALATVIAQAVSFLCAIVFLWRRREAFCFDFRPASFRISPEMLRTLLKLGIPMVLQAAAISFSKVFITSWVNSYGVEASAVSGIGNKLQTLTNVFAQALSTSGASMIAQCIGAEKYQRVPKVIRTSVCFDGAVAALMSAVIILFPRWVFGFFTDDEAVLALAASYVPVAVLLFTSCVFRSPMIALINGSGNSRLNLAIGLLDGVACRIGFAAILGFACGFGIYGFWYGNAISGFVPFLIGFPYYLSGKWRTKKYLLK